MIWSLLMFIVGLALGTRYSAKIKVRLSIWDDALEAKIAEVIAKNKEDND